MLNFSQSALFYMRSKVWSLNFLKYFIHDCCVARSWSVHHQNSKNFRKEGKNEKREKKRKKERKNYQ